MGFGRYLADHALGIVLALLGVAGAAIVMGVHGLDAGAIAFACALVVAGGLAALLAEHLRRRGFYRSLAASLDALDRAYLLSEMESRPEFAEGALFYDALQRADKAAGDEVARYRRASEEYREYVETWIHEVKTPIAAAHLIASNDGGSVARAMDAEVARIEGFAEQALYYARSEAVEQDLHIRSVQLGDVVRAAVRMRSRELLDAQVSPVLGELGFTVHADPKWLEFVIGQLLVNAAKYRRPDASDGAEPARVTLRAHEEQAGLDTVNVVLEMEDNGIGIPAADVPRVFDKGFTGENGRIFAKSTGMGLYLCKSLCAKMGLDVTLTSTQSTGTTVRVIFPDNKMNLGGDKVTGHLSPFLQ